MPHSRHIFSPNLAALGATHYLTGAIARFEQKSISNELGVQPQRGGHFTKKLFEYATPQANVFVGHKSVFNAFFCVSISSPRRFARSANWSSPSLPTVKNCDAGWAK